MASATAPIMVITNPGPVPPIRRTGGRPGIYPFPELKVGQAFDVPRCGIMDAGTCRTQRNVSSAAINWARRNAPSAKFTVRVINKNIVRCWRIA